jgi:putative ABC transport system permease protein
MLALARRTLAERRGAFAGSFLAVALGVATLTASVAVLVSAASPGESADGQEGMRAVGTVFAFIAVLFTFLSVFIIAATLNFAVASRARELALLRLVGATERQIVALVRAEALVVGLLGAVGGYLLGLLGAVGLTVLLPATGAVPPGFALSPLGAVVSLPVALLVGTGVCVLGARSAARAAGRLPALAALRESDVESGVMTRRRWVLGLLALAAGAAMTAGLAGIDAEARMPLSMGLAFPFVVAGALLAPVFVGPLSRLVTAPLARFTAASGTLAGGNLRAGVRRSAATAGPILLAIGVTGSLLGATAVLSAGTVAAAREYYASDVVTDSRPPASTPGVVRDDRVLHGSVAVTVGADTPPQNVDAVAVEPDAVSSVLLLRGVDGDLAEFGTAEAVGSREYMSTLNWKLGAQLPVTLPDGSTERVRLVAVFDGGSLNQKLLLPFGLLDQYRGGGVTETHHLSVADGVPAERVATALGGQTTAEWVDRTAGAQGRLLRLGAWALCAPALLYLLLAVANTAALSFGSRRAEFAVLRRVGMTRPQLRRMVTWESLALGLIGAVIGGVIAIGASLVMWVVVRAGIPSTPFVLPIAEVVLLAAGCALLTAAVAVGLLRRA